MTPTKLLIAIMDLHGGAGTFCRLLAAGLRRHHPDLQPHLLLWRDRGLLPADPATFSSITRLNTSIHRGPLRLLDLAAEPPRLRRALRTIRPDVILTAGTYANLLLPRLTRTPVVMTEHNHLSTLLAHSSRRASAPLLKAAMRAAYRRLPLAVPSEGVASDLRQNFAATNVHVIPHGLDRDQILSLAREATPDLPPPHSYIIAVGRLTPQKDYPTLLRAYALARAQGVTQSLLILGTGPDLPHLQSLSHSLNLTNHVTFLGHRDNPYPYLAGAHCYVLSSIYEGFGLALLEALTLSLPSISTNCPSGPSEILSDGAYGPLVPMSSPPALAAALHTLCTDPATHARYASLAEQRSHTYSLQSMATRYHSLLRRLTDNPRL